MLHMLDECGFIFKLERVDLIPGETIGNCFGNLKLFFCFFEPTINLFPFFGLIPNFGLRNPLFLFLSEELNLLIVFCTSLDPLLLFLLLLVKYPVEEYLNTSPLLFDFLDEYLPLLY